MLLVFYQINPNEWHCGGHLVWDGNSNNLTVWGDDTRTTEKDGFAVGEEFIFKLWDSQLNKEWDAIATFLSGPSVYEINGISILSSLSTFSNEINIDLNNGWNLISSNVIPEELSLDSIFKGINNIVIVKNGAGQFYSPAFGINQLGDWNVEDGYYVYTNNSGILNISGIQVNPLQNEIQLNAGWNLVSYLRNSLLDVQQALASISNSLILVKDNIGNIYHPFYGINTIGDMQPRKGYWLYMSAPAVLIYPGN